MNAALDPHLAAALRTVGKEFPASLRAAVLAAGELAIPELIAIAEDADLASDDGPTEGWPPIHAAELLIDLKAHAAIEPLLRVLVESSWEDTLHERIAARLPELGPAVAEPTLALLHETDDVYGDYALCDVLAKLGIRDDRIFDALRELFVEDELLGVECFGDYGDARALPILEDAIRKFVPEWSSATGIYGLADLVATHAKLGGSLSAELTDRISALRVQWTARRAVRLAREGGKKIGRNDPCPCGSGKKYKKCCLEHMA